MQDAPLYWAWAVEEKKPDWVSDAHANSCASCAIEFTLLNRKHHCRMCGKIFCQPCTSRRVVLPRMGYLDPVRVCKSCLNALSAAWQRPTLLDQFVDLQPGKAGVVIPAEIWVYASYVTFFGVRLRCNMIVHRMKDRRLLVYSPGALDAATSVDLSMRGEVAVVIAPNKIHNVHLADWQAAFPTARYYFAPGLKERCPALRCDGVIDQQFCDQHQKTDQTDADVWQQLDWQSDFQVLVTPGNVFFSEILLYHRRSRTLFVADFIENFPLTFVDEASKSTSGRFLSWFVDGIGVPIPSPEHAMFVQDADGFEQWAVNVLLKLDVDMIVMSHGVPIQGRMCCKVALESVCEVVLHRVRGRYFVTSSALSLLSKFA